MKTFSEREKQAFRHKLAYLSKTVAPKALPADKRQAVFLRLSRQLEQVPVDFWPHFALLTRLFNKLRDKSEPQHIGHDRLIEVYSHLRDNKCLTSHAYAAAICTPVDDFATPEESEKYSRYQALVILSCLQLHIVGQHGSAIDNALREIRLIAIEQGHRPLLALLPDLVPSSSANDLIHRLHQLRKQTMPPLLQRGLGFLDVAISDACRMAKGVIRHREVEYYPSQEEDLALTQQEPTDETDLAVFELSTSRSQANPELDESDEPLDIQPGKIISIKEPSSPHKARALRALQSKRLAEQLGIRQQSLPCNFEQASEWDIQHLVAETVKLISGHTDLADAAAVLLLSLVSGRSAERLFYGKNASSLLQEIKQHPCLHLTHSVPASKQGAACDPLLTNVREHLILPLPAVLKGRLSLSSLDSDKLKRVIHEINDRHQTRLTLGRIVRYLDHWYLNQGRDRAEIALIRGESPKSRPALSYSNLDADLIIQHHRDYLDALFSTAGIDHALPALHPTHNRLGSRLALPGHVLHNLFAMLSPPNAGGVANKLDDIFAFHNQYVCYIWALLTFATGHRDVTAPMGQLDDYNPHTRTWWISDKEIRHGLAARTVVLPATAARQLELYLDHLAALAKRCRHVAPNIDDRCRSASAGSGNLLFAITTPLGRGATPADLCPSLLEHLLGNKMPWARNWPRHHLRSELKRHGIAPELIDGWMGHEDLGEEALGQHSVLSLHHLDQIADRIEQILKDHNIEALPGWQTR